MKTTGLFTVSGGNVVSDVNGIAIFATNPTVDTQNNTSQAGVRVSSGNQNIKPMLQVINDNVKESSLFQPATEDLP